jgi:DNA (cytosine-5)-methyltransferase 1
VNRVFLPSSDIFPTLVASDTNDYVAVKSINPTDKDDYKRQFLEEIYRKGNYRKITKAEACRIQGFPEDFVLPESRARWMKLIGNSVSVPVIDMLCRAIVKTGVFEERNRTRVSATPVLAGVSSKRGK